MKTLDIYRYILGIVFCLFIIGTSFLWIWIVYAIWIAFKMFVMAYWFKLLMLSMVAGLGYLFFKFA